MGGGYFCTLPNEIDVPSSISAGTGREEAQHAAAEHTTQRFIDSRHREGRAWIFS